MDKTAIVRRFIQEAGSTIVSVKFVKKTGEMRQLSFNPRDRQEIKGTGNPTQSPQIVRCRDFAVVRKEGKGAWRSFDCERVLEIRAKGRTVRFAGSVETLRKG